MGITNGHSPTGHQPTTQTRPALAIGLGTTGCQALTWFKAMVQALPDQSVPIACLGFDTADEPLTVPGPRGLVALQPNVEFFNVGNVPVAKIKENLSHHAAIAERLGPALHSLPPVTLRGNGAKQNPLLGLLCWLWHQPMIEKRLRAAITSLASRDHAAAGREAGINCFIFAGSSGGSGHGGIFDTAYHVRDLFGELGTAGDYCHITLMALLPDAYRGVDGPFLKANAGSFLRELEHTMMQGGFTSRYPSGRMIEGSAPPFDLVVLVDGIDENGHTWTSVNDVCRMVGEAAVLQSRSQVGKRGANNFDNLGEVVGQGTATGEGTFAASLNVATLHFDGPAVAAQLARATAAAIVRDHLLASVTEEQLTRLAQGGSSLIGPEHMPERLRRDEQGVMVQVELTSGLPGWIGRRGPTDRARETIRYGRDYLRTRLESDFPQAIQNAAARLGRDLGARLDEWVVGAAQGHLPGAEAALVRLGSSLHEQATLADRERSGAQAEADRLLAELPPLEEALLAAAEANFFVRESRLSAAESAYLQTAQAGGEARLRALVAGAQAELLQRLGTLLARHVARLSRARLVVTEAMRLLEVGGAATKSSGTTIELADEALLALFETEYAPAPEEARHALLGLSGAPFAWAEFEPPALADLLSGALTSAFAPVAQMSVEEAILTRADHVSPAMWRSRLQSLAAPSWNLERTRLTEGGAALARVTVLGVPQAESSCFRDQAEDLVSTGDPTRVVAFQMVAGAPLSALAVAPVLARAVKQAPNRHTPHVLPAFLRARGDQTLAFALAGIFGLITNRGVYFYYQPADSLDEPRRLGQGLQTALATFNSDETLAREALSRVEAEIATIGLRSALERLEAYIAEEGGDEVTRSLKKAVRDHAQRLELAAREAEQFKVSKRQGTGVRG